MNRYRYSFGVPQLSEDFARSHPLTTALALSLAAAIALGFTRFSYGVLLPPMRADLGWSYLVAGAMNTGNAVGYLTGALTAPALMRAFGVWRVLVVSCVLAVIFMLLSGVVFDTAALLLQRTSSGVVSAYIFIAGGVLAARLGTLRSERAGFLIGLYYGGTGLGIALSALAVPVAQWYAEGFGAAHAWQWSWLALGVACLVATAILALPARAIGEAPAASGQAQHFALKSFAFGLCGYFMFGVGCIGYMTFVVALLNEQGLRPGLITGFYTLLGLAVVASSRIWARMLERFKGGESLAILNGVLGVAAILPALTSNIVAVFVSSLVFGGVFLSVVASTTALVRHNLPQAGWSVGISAFTVVFAVGQIVGPAMVGWIADGPGGLERGLIVSAVALFIGAALASRQKALALAPSGLDCSSR